jgi:hypothetical protein
MCGPSRGQHVHASSKSRYIRIVSPFNQTWTLRQVLVKQPKLLACSWSSFSNRILTKPSLLAWFSQPPKRVQLGHYSHAPHAHTPSCMCTHVHLLAPPCLHSRPHSHAFIACPCIAIANHHHAIAHTFSVYVSRSDLFMYTILLARTSRMINILLKICLIFFEHFSDIKLKNSKLESHGWVWCFFIGLYAFSFFSP